MEKAELTANVLEEKFPKRRNEICKYFEIEKFSAGYPR